MPSPASQARAVTGWLAARPALATALVALVVRLVVVWDAWLHNPLVRLPQLDGKYYLQWADEIAKGDALSANGIVAHEPFLLNPLYAYLLAPFQAAAPGTPMLLPALLMNVVLACGATALAAGAAHRFLDRRAAWCTGLLVAFSTVLAQLDPHVAVSELAAFLVAGACFAMAPPREGDSRFAHGPVATGLWTGIGALARPIAPFALPFALLLHWRRAGTDRWKRVGACGALLAVHFACAMPSLYRNWKAADVPVLYTAAGGINLHLGNNPVARDHHAMMSSHFRFNPTQMHEDASRYVEEAIGHRPTRDEVSQFFIRMTIREITDHPLDSFLHYMNKVRWFFGATEVPSSASVVNDRIFQSWLWIAFLPTWLIGALAVGGAWVQRRNRELLLGAGGMVAAHVFVLVLVFPLSHYRSPCVPALAILGGCGLSAAWAAWRGGERRAAAGWAAACGLAAVAAALPPPPDRLDLRDCLALSFHYKEAGDLDTAEMWAQKSIPMTLEAWPDEPEPAAAWQFIGEIRCRRAKQHLDEGRLAGPEWESAADALRRAVDLDPFNWESRLNLAEALDRTGHFREAEEQIRWVIAKYPRIADGWLALAEHISRIPERIQEAQRAYDEALKRGGERRASPALRRRLGR